MHKYRIVLLITHPDGRVTKSRQFVAKGVSEEAALAWGIEKGQRLWPEAKIEGKLLTPKTGEGEKA